MFSLNDLKYLFFSNRGFTGSISEKLYKYLGGENLSINEREYRKLSEDGFNSLSLQERRFHKLDSLGYEGAYPDKEQKYLLDNLSPSGSSFWSGGVWGSPAGNAIFDFAVWGS